MKIVPAVAILAAGLNITNGAAQDAAKQPDTKTLSGTIIKGHGDQLSSPGVPIDVPQEGAEISFEPMRVELAKNEE